MNSYLQSNGKAQYRITCKFGLVEKKRFFYGVVKLVAPFFDAGSNTTFQSLRDTERKQLREGLIWCKIGAKFENFQRDSTQRITVTVALPPVYLGIPEHAPEDCTEIHVIVKRYCDRSFEICSRDVFSAELG